MQSALVVTSYLCWFHIDIDTYKGEWLNYKMTKREQRSVVSLIGASESFEEKGKLTEQSGNNLVDGDPN